jgi:DNA-binding transcriptional ArsR family regulator
MTAILQSINLSATDSGNTGELARVFKALADPLRLDILRVLRTESFGVLELCRIVDVRQSALSHHLKILAQAELVSTRREGNSIFYRRTMLVSDDPLYDIKAAAFAAMDEMALRCELANGIQQIQDERSEQSLLFFERHAERFLAKQELVAEYAHYRDTLHDLLDGLKLPADARVMEVGPGESPLLSELAKRFKHLTALDNSIEMLNRARNALAHRAAADKPLAEVEFIHGDTHLARDSGQHFDLLIYNMVLHHISSPLETFQDCASLLANNGTLLLIDLSHHDQDWVRESCGDLWLGFTEQDLDAWSAESGLECGPRVYLGLRNGFQVQMRLFTKIKH